VGKVAEYAGVDRDGLGLGVWSLEANGGERVIEAPS
jgi:hypothetical protein